MRVAKETAVHAIRTAASFIDRHAVKLTVVLTALLICLPTYLVYNYSVKVGRVAEQAKRNSQTNRRLSRENKRLTVSLRDGLVEGCRTSGNPLRAAVRQFGGVLIDQTKAEIQQGEAFEKSGAYAEFFPGISAPRLHQLLAKQRLEKSGEIKGIRAAIKGIPAVDCVEQYSPLNPR